MKVEVLTAGSTVSEAGDARFTLAALNLSEDSNNEVRQTVRYVYEGGQRGTLNLDTPEAPDPHLVSKVVEILQHGSPDSQAVVLPLLGALPENSVWEKQTDVQDALRSMLEAKPRPANYAQVLEAASSFKSLLNPDANISAAALDTLRKVKGVEQRPDFRAAMEKLKTSSNPRLKLICTSVLQGKHLSEALKDVQPGSVLDFRYFVTKIEPILAKPGADGKACVFCHASHVIFKLAPPNAEGVFSDQDSKENYRYAMRVVDITNPDQSLMLIKPTRPTDSAGNVGDYLATHNGGQRWHGNESSDQYRTILEWIRGGRLEDASLQK